LCVIYTSLYRLYFCLSFRLLPPALPLFPYTTLFRSRFVVITYSRRGRRNIGRSDWTLRFVQEESAREIHSRYWLALFLGSMTIRSEEHTSELQSPDQLVCRLLLEKKKIGSGRKRRAY